MKKTFRTLIKTGVTVAAATALLFTTITPATAATTSTTAACNALKRDIYQTVNPKTGASILTQSQSEVKSSSEKYGFTENKGTVFKASTTKQDGLYPVYRLYNYKAGNWVWIPKWEHSNEYELAQSKYGYKSDHIEFYAATKKIDCGVGVHRFAKNGKFRFAADEAEKTKLAAAGWKDDGARFWVKPATATTPPTTPPVTPPVTPEPQPGETTFSLAILPDTQQEVFNNSKDRFNQRNQWLVANKDKLNLKYALHSGDVVNWGNVDENQYIIASKAMKTLTDGGIPSALAIGNHDTGAVCEGGSACPGKNPSITVRDTAPFNKYFPVSANKNIKAVYETGKIDNNYQSFTAGGKTWGILTLELWPRTGVVDWANKIVAQNPTHNVIVLTHSYLNGDGSISTSNGGYGANSPKYVYDNLIKKYANIKMVFSGHTGNAAMREDIGVNGNKIVSYLQTFHSTTNPVRILKIDTKNGTLETNIYAPFTNESYTQYNNKTTGLKFN